MTTVTTIAADGTVTTRALTVEEIAELAALGSTGPVVPASVPKLALVRAMRQVGLDGDPENPVKAWTVVKGALAAASEEVQEDWELSTRIPRNYQAILDIATALSVPSEILDAVFILAESIDVAG